MKGFIAGFNIVAAVMFLIFMAAVITAGIFFDSRSGAFHPDIRSRTDKLDNDDFSKYKYLFDNAGIGLLIEDYSAIYRKFIKLKNDGVENIAAFFESNPKIIREIAGMIRIIDVNDEAIRLFRAEDRQCMITTLDSLFTDLSYIQFTEQLVNLYNGNRHYTIENINRTADGKEIDVLLTFTFPESAEEAENILVSVMDISRLKSMERLIMEEKEKFAVILASIADGVIVTDIYGNVVLENSEAEKILGYSREEMKGKKLYDFIDVYSSIDGRPENFRERIGKKLTKTNDLVLKDRTGKLKNISEAVSTVKDQSDKIIGYVFIFRDITDQIKIENETRNMQKIESIGILAGGIAHDFNNLLTSITGNISLCKTGVSEESDLRSMLDDAEKAAGRAQSLTHQLLTFARGGEPVKKTVNLREILNESLSLVLAGSRITAEIEFCGDGSYIFADEGQISQVFNNIIINAKQAMPEGGVLHVSCERSETVPGEQGMEFSGSENRRYVKINFRDEGPGVPDEIADSIFDPFFTTKKTGTGLGLATSFSIIKNHGGILRYNNGGTGADFCIYLPEAENPVQSTPEQEMIKHGKGRILLLDDDSLIVKIAVKMMKHLGYSSDSAETGEKAVEMFRKAHKSGNGYSAVILDLTLPSGMGGMDVIVRMKEIDPEIKCIVSSGYSENPVLSNYEDYGFSEVLKKPFNLQDLGKVLQKVCC